jgi:predicted  nucleic acid-binding Zn-ribbon protein
MNTRPTPETDKFFATFADGEATPSHAEYYARLQDLERERDEWKEKYIDLKSQLTQTHGCVTISRNGYVQELERELAEAREETIRTREFMDYGFAKAQEELATVTEQRDRLAVALKETISGYDVVTESIPSLCSDYVHNVIDPLLAAVKG